MQYVIIIRFIAQQKGLQSKDKNLLFNILVYNIIYDMTAFNEEIKTWNDLILSN